MTPQRRRAVRCSPIGAGQVRGPASRSRPFPYTSSSPEVRPRLSRAFQFPACRGFLTPSSCTSTGLEGPWGAPSRPRPHPRRPRRRLRCRCPHTRNPWPRSRRQGPCGRGRRPPARSNLAGLPAWALPTLPTSASGSWRFRS